MIAMLMRNEDGFYLVHGQADAFHALHCFAATDARINKHRLVGITYIIAIAITARCDGCYEK